MIGATELVFTDTRHLYSDDLRITFQYSGHNIFDCVHFRKKFLTGDLFLRNKCRFDIQLDALVYRFMNHQKHVYLIKSRVTLDVSNQGIFIYFSHPFSNLKIILCTQTSSIFALVGKFLLKMYIVG